MANLEIIRDLAVRKGITLRELCRRIGRDESTLQSAIRRGSTNSGTLEAVAKELGVSAAIFFDDYGPDKTSQLELELAQFKELLKENENKVAHLKELLKEKERLIDVLMGDRKC